MLGGAGGGAWRRRGAQGPLQGLQWGARDLWLPHTALPCPSAGIAVGFYGNGETSDGIHRATYSLRHANRTVAGVQDRVSGHQDEQGLFLLLKPVSAHVPERVGGGLGGAAEGWVGAGATAP